MAKSNISLKINRLENDLGIRLFERTTRQIKLTQMGQSLTSLVDQILECEREINNLAEDKVTQPEGLIRISVPTDIGHYLTRYALPDFFQKNPLIKVDLDITNRFVDLVSEGFDLAIRAGGLGDSSLISVKLCDTDLKLYASRGFIKKNQAPKTVAQLDGHNVIAFPSNRKNQLTISKDGVPSKIKTSGNLGVNDMGAVKQAVLADYGIGILPQIICRDEVNKGEFVEIMENWVARQVQLQLIYPSRRLLPKRTKVFIAYLRQFFAN